MMPVKKMFKYCFLQMHLVLLIFYLQYRYFKYEGEPHAPRSPGPLCRMLVGDR